MHSSRMRTGRSLTVFRSLQPGGCTWSGGVPGPGGCTWSQGGVPGLGGMYLVWGYLVLGGCTWSRGVYLVRGGYLVPGGCTWSGVCTWSLGGTWAGGVPGPGGCTWSRGVYLVRYSPPPCEQNDKQV